jgi:hypothetical protein
MIRFGAIFQSIARKSGVAVSSVVLGLRLALLGRLPRPCPIPIPVDARRRRR